MTDKPTILTYRQLQVLFYLYRIALDDVRNGKQPGKFRGLMQLAVDLKCHYRSIIGDINDLAESNFIDLIYSSKRGMKKTYSIPGGTALYTKLLPTIKELEGALITIYNLTGKTACIDLIKFDSDKKGEI